MQPPLFIAAGTSPVAAEDATGGCVEPVPVRSYTHDQLTYRLALDLTDCDWWDRKPTQLDAALDRIDPSGDGGGAGSLAWCGVGPLSPERYDMSDEARPEVEGATGAGSAQTAPQPDDSTGMRPGACAVEVSIDHPPLDIAHYKGSITFPWQDGRRTVSFNAVCHSATDCIDLPADPTTALAPAADLYNAIAGDSDAG
ncbi:MAG: hypothetical protein LC792_22935 [Actinobacteria bacterium]|nr:hypothetical protein [Actinomycetota bacterium]